MDTSRLPVNNAGRQPHFREGKRSPLFWGPLLPFFSCPLALSASNFIFPFYMLSLFLLSPFPVHWSLQVQLGVGSTFWCILSHGNVSDGMWIFIGTRASVWTKMTTDQSTLCEVIYWCTEGGWCNYVWQRPEEKTEFRGSCHNYSYVPAWTVTPSLWMFYNF